MGIHRSSILGDASRQPRVTLNKYLIFFPPFSHLQYLFHQVVLRTKCSKDNFQNKAPYKHMLTFDIYIFGF